MEERLIPLDAETKVAERPHDHKDELRLWLRLFTCKEVVEGEVRRRLRERFNLTLPRFDLMAQLDRTPKGMTLGELSKRMMVSNGNVTGLAERLVEQGLLDRRASPNDRRAQIVSLTAEGRRVFRMAPLHHHFELLGWKETTVVARFWILSIMCAFLGLATLKLR